MVKNILLHSAFGLASLCLRSSIDHAQWHLAGIETIDTICNSIHDINIAWYSLYFTDDS
jgi:hypothetical protein